MTPYLPCLVLSIKPFVAKALLVSLCVQSIWVSVTGFSKYSLCQHQRLQVILLLVTNACFILSWAWLVAPSNPKRANFPGFCFPKRYVKSNKNTLFNPYLLHKTMENTHLSQQSRCIYVKLYLRLIYRPTIGRSPNSNVHLLPKNITIQVCQQMSKRILGTQRT